MHNATMHYLMPSWLRLHAFSRVYTYYMVLAAPWLLECLLVMHMADGDLPHYSTFPLHV